MSFQVAMQEFYLKDVSLAVFGWFLLLNEIPHTAMDQSI